jgi:hypothetical protein
MLDCCWDTGLRMGKSTIIRNSLKAAAAIVALDLSGCATPPRTGAYRSEDAVRGLGRESVGPPMIRRESPTTSQDIQRKYREEQVAKWANFTKTMDEEKMCEKLTALARDYDAQSMGLMLDALQGLATAERYEATKRYVIALNHVRKLSEPAPDTTVPWLQDAWLKKVAEEKGPRFVHSAEVADAGGRALLYCYAYVRPDDAGRVAGLVSNTQKDPVASYILNREVPLRESEGRKAVADTMKEIAYIRLTKGDLDLSSYLSRK